jgi:hypothetical protein
MPAALGPATVPASLDALTVNGGFPTTRMMLPEPLEEAKPRNRMLLWTGVVVVAVAVALAMRYLRR